MWTQSAETWEGVEQRSVRVIKESKEESMLGFSSSFSFTLTFTFRPQFLTKDLSHNTKTLSSLSNQSSSSTTVHLPKYYIKNHGLLQILKNAAYYLKNQNLLRTRSLSLIFFKYM